MKTMKKAISVLLLVCMVSALCSAGAYADTTAGTGGKSSTTPTVNANLTIGTGTYNVDINTTENITITPDAAYTDVYNALNTSGGKWWASRGTGNYIIAFDEHTPSITTGSTPGTDTLTVKLEGDYSGTHYVFSGSATINVNGIVLAADNPTQVKVGESITLTAEKYGSVSTSTISWDSEVATPGKVTVVSNDTTATVTGVAEYSGLAIIAHDADYKYTASATVTVTAPDAKLVDSIVVSASSTQITAGTGNVQMNVDSITPDNAKDKTYTWSVTGNATIDVNGVVRPNIAAAVNDVISVKAIANDAGRKESNTVQLTVVAATIPATSITINSSKGNVLTVGDTTNLTATASPSGSSVGTVTWSGSSAVADVNASTGVVTAKSAGKVTVTATANDTVSGNAVTGTYEITVNPVAPTSVTVTPSEATIELSTTTTPNTKQLTATVLPDNAENKTVIWSSSNTAVATVTADTGVVTAVSKGTAVITATVKDTALTSVCTVTVTEPAAYKINLTPNTITLGQGNVNYFTATILDKDGKNVSGSDKSITWSFTGDTSDGIGITSNGYNSTNNNYTATVLGKFNRNYVVTASCSIGGVVYSSGASVTVSFTPAIVSGQNAVYNGRDAMSFVVNDSAQNFNGHVYVDGRELSNVYYSTSNYNGYLVVTLNQSFLNFLCQYYNNNGYHTLSVDTKYGAAASYFRTWGTASSFNGVKTGDDANLGLWAALLAVSAVGAGAAVIIVKRRKTNNG